MSSHELKMAHEYTYTPIRFEVWRAENSEDLKKEFDDLNMVNEEKNCDKCEGYGTIDCDLGFDHDCPDCEGSGKTDQTPEEALYDYSINQYHEQIKKDKEKLKAHHAI